ncbi:unnamed protein product, partial [Prorocentrum cordatum]
AARGARWPSRWRGASRRQQCLPAASRRRRRSRCDREGRRAGDDGESSLPVASSSSSLQLDSAGQVFSRIRASLQLDPTGVLDTPAEVRGVISCIGPLLFCQTV